MTAFHVDHWRKLACMRHPILVAVLALFILPIVNPSMSSIPAAIIDEPFEAPFLTAADGDESTDSVPSFNKTLDDDVLFFPDVFDNSTAHLAVAGSAFPGTDYGSYLKTHVDDADNYETTLGEVAYIILNFTLSSSVSQYESFRIHAQIICSITLSDGMIQVQDYEDNWINITGLAPGTNIYNIDEDFGNSTFWGGFVGPTLSIRVYKEYIGHSTYVGVDFVHIYPSHMTLADSDHYAESFADVSDISISAGSVSTDGDVLSWEYEFTGDNQWIYLWSNAPSAMAQEMYREIRWQTNESLEYFRSYAYSADDRGGTAGYEEVFSSDPATPWATYNGLQDYTASFDIECLAIAIRDDTGTKIKLELDYDRYGSATEQGWAHDGSTTAGLSGAASYSSDSDVLNISTIGNYEYVNFFIDSTVTKACLDKDHYMVVEVKIDSLNDADSDGEVWKIQTYDGSVITNLNSYTDETGVIRFNLKAAAGGDIQYFRFQMRDDEEWVTVDYVQAFSIANFTVTQSGVGTDDYLYVSGGALVSTVDSGYIELNHDPALSVSDTYPVYNLTTSGTAPQFSQYVSSWSTYSDDTRGATTSGTVTDIKLKFDSTEVLSAIKFIEDGTAPAVVRSSSTPNDPSDDEGVMLTAVVTDAVEVYKVYFDAIVSPAGFSDVPYYATEQTDNLWTYEFATLPTGPYVFKIVATDGANENALTEYAYIELTVREAAITIEEITLAGAGSDFSMMTFSARINKDCSYVIYEESENNAEAATHSGSVSSPSFNLAWTKLDTTDTNVNFTIKFTNSTLTYNYTSQYQVAFTTLQVTDDSIRTTASYAYLTGHVNLNANYTVYEETVQVGTGSVSAGSFEIRWTKASSDVENVTVLFESGSQTYPVYSGYDVAAQVTFVVESWWMDLNLGVESYVEFYVLSSFENATVYVYDNTTLMTTVTESAGGAYSYFWLSESEGLHTITLNITHGATVHTRTRTYYVPDWAATGLVMRWDLWTFQDNYTMLELESNWMNCTYYVYLNSSLVATSANDPVILNFTRAINIGTYNLTIYADAGAQTYTIKNIRYIITEEGVSYDYSSVVGGRSVREGDIYEGDVYEGDTHENPPGIYMTAETAATIAVSTVFIFFLAVLFMNSRVKKAQLDRDKKGTQ